MIPQLPEDDRSELSGHNKGGVRSPVYKRAVVPLDGSIVAETIIPFILEIAGPLDLEVVMLRVIPPIPATTIQDSRPSVVEGLQAKRTDAEEYLGSLGRRTAPQGRAVPDRGAPR